MAHKKKEIIRRTSDMTAVEYNRLITSGHEVQIKKGKRKQLGRKKYTNK
jgi:hypothetical protein